jgi:hypothetical protein
MANYRVLPICNDRKIKIRYNKEKNHIVIETPKGEVIDGHPSSLLDKLDLLHTIILKMVPGDKLVDSGCDIDDRVVEDDASEDVEPKKREPLNSQHTDSVVEAIASVNIAADTLKRPASTAQAGINHIKAHLPEFRPEDAAELLSEMSDGAVDEFTIDITKWAVEERKTKIKTRT